MAGLSSLVLLVVAGWLVLRHDIYEVTPASPQESSGAAGAASALLHSLEVAVAHRDTGAARVLAADGSAAADLAAVVENARALDVRDFSLRYVDDLGVRSADGTWDAAVATTWAFSGFDAQPARSEILVRFASRDGALAIEAVGGGGRRTPVWLSGPVAVHRDARVLVLARPGAAGAPDESSAGHRRDATRVVREVAQRARLAVERVSLALEPWRGRVVVEVPASAADLDAALAAPAGTYAQIAAVTTGSGDGVGGAAPVHVFVNPEVSDRLRRRGAQVVMTHEVVHVATDAAGSAMPLWLLEGFADHVALRSVRLPLTVTAGRAIAAVRRDGVPAALPGPQDFDPRAEDLQAAYEAAWLACEVVADRLGAPALRQLYADVRQGASVDEALATAGWDQDGLVQAWRERLRDLARDAA